MRIISYNRTHSSEESLQEASLSKRAVRVSGTNLKFLQDRISFRLVLLTSIFVPCEQEPVQSCLALLLRTLARQHFDIWNITETWKVRCQYNGYHPLRSRLLRPPLLLDRGNKKLPFLVLRQKKLVHALHRWDSAKLIPCIVLEGETDENPKL